ncbi:MAG: SIS domain-containing protein [Pseudomonadota bacterium]
MSLIPHRPPDAWTQAGASHTAQEISQQPAIWRELATLLGAHRAQLDAFLGPLLANPACRVILTGAGSSAYIGEIAADSLNAALPASVRAIPTTSLLTHAALYLDPQAPTLLVSCARSGNSPESVAAVELVRRQVAHARFLNITCSADGALATSCAHDAASLNLLLPPASCDRSFAMTSSFSAMLLSLLAVLGSGSWDTRLQRIEQLASAAAPALQAWSGAAEQLARHPCARVVCLGSGPLESLAKEAALKVLELTSGRVLALANTCLGFRHGPKAVVDCSTLIVVFLSADPLARRYELDLVAELKRDRIARLIVQVGPDLADGPTTFGSPAPAGLDDAWLAPLWLLMAQQFALHKSLLLGLTPDNPFPDGSVNRVVQGVTIYHGADHAIA